MKLIHLVAAATLTAVTGGAWASQADTASCPGGQTTLYTPIPGGGYEARAAACRSPQVVAAAKVRPGEIFAPRTDYQRLREVSGATNMERLQSLAMEPPGARDNSMGRSTPP